MRYRAERREKGEGGRTELAPTALSALHLSTNPNTKIGAKHGVERNGSNQEKWCPGAGVINL